MIVHKIKPIEATSIYPYTKKTKKTSLSCLSSATRKKNLELAQLEVEETRKFDRG